MSPLEAGLIGGTLVGLATVGLSALARAVTADPAETAWVRLVVDQLDAHGVWDDGVIVVYIGPSPYAEEHGALGWTVRIDGRRAVWTSSRAELLERLRTHYRISRAAAAEGARWLSEGP